MQTVFTKCQHKFCFNEYLELKVELVRRVKPNRLKLVLFYVFFQQQKSFFQLM